MFGGYNGSTYALYAYIRNVLKPIKEYVGRHNPNAFKAYNTNR